MKPKTRIEKGKLAEKEVARRIERAGLGQARRSAGSGNGNRDKGDLVSGLKFLLEIKNEKTTNFLSNVDQSKHQAEIGNYDFNKWCLVTVDPRGVQEPERMTMYATIELDELLSLFKKNSESKVKEPDRNLKLKLELLKEYCRRLESDQTDRYYFQRFKLLCSQIIKEL